MNKFVVFLTIFSIVIIICFSSSSSSSSSWKSLVLKNERFHLRKEAFEVYNVNDNVNDNVNNNVNNNVNVNDNDIVYYDDDDDTNEEQLLKTTLFVDKCVGSNITIYVTPIGECYSGKDYTFGSSISNSNSNSDSNPYGENDIIDELVVQVLETNDNSNDNVNFNVNFNVNVNSKGKGKNNVKIISGISRSFYKSTNGTCTGGIKDSFPNIPLDTCVGPFGMPYPWGVLKLITQKKNSMSSTGTGRSTGSDNSSNSVRTGSGSSNVMYDTLYE